MWDAVIVGARCAGASTALLLARHGHRVLLVDRATFPSETMSTLYIHQPGVALLDRWGVLDSIIASGCPRIQTATYHIQDVVLHGPLAPFGDITATYAPRRHILDQLLINAAVKAGAEFAEGCSVSALLYSGDRVAGVRFRTRSGGEATEDARLVIGADGMRSRVAELAGAPFNIENQRASCIYYSGWTGIKCGLGMREWPGRSIGTVPTHDDVTLILTYFPQDDFPTIKSDPFKAHLESIRTMAPDLFDEISASEQAGKLQGTGDQQNFFRKAHGPGWALIGDAGHHLDSITARGITNAFIQAELLTDAVGSDLADERHLDAGLSRFAEARHERLIDDYYNTLETAKLQVKESRLKMLRAISQVPALTERYFALVAGIISMEELLTPELAKLLFKR
ncbi:MAG TPA: NAD(P)/FAD-dependent oxidoreductase [Streptosporangiaceae bacterium]